MKWLKRLLWGGLFLLILIVAFTFLPYFNDYQSEGKLLLTGLTKTDYGQTGRKRDGLHLC